MNYCVTGQRENIRKEKNDYNNDDSYGYADDNNGGKSKNNTKGYNTMGTFCFAMQHFERRLIFEFNVIHPILRI
jgi:hypothetical protein